MEFIETLSAVMVYVTTLPAMIAGVIMFVAPCLVLYATLRATKKRGW